jgi:hypothetical protein
VQLVAVAVRAMALRDMVQLPAVVVLEVGLVSPVVLALLILVVAVAVAGPTV